MDRPRQQNKKSVRQQKKETANILQDNSQFLIIVLSDIFDTKSDRKAGRNRFPDRRTIDDDGYPKERQDISLPALLTTAGRT